MSAPKCRFACKRSGKLLLKHVWSRSYETLSPEVRAIWSLPRSPRVADGVRMLMEKMLLRWARWGKQMRDRSRSATLRVLAIAAPSATRLVSRLCKTE
jgi:hypothetical protein